MCGHTADKSAEQNHFLIKYENFGKKSLADTGYEENRQISAAAESVSLIIIFIQKGEESHEIYQT